MYLFKLEFSLDICSGLVFLYHTITSWWLRYKEPACNAGDLGSASGWGRSPGEGNGFPMQYSCLEISIDRGAWQGRVHGVGNSCWLFMMILFLVFFFKEFLYYSSQWLYWLTFPQHCRRVPFSAHPFLNLLFIVFFNDCNSHWSEVKLHYNFDLY